MPRWLSLYGSCLFFGLATIGYAEKPHFSEGVAGGGSLKVRDTVAVLSLSGTPAEIGEEEARLVAKQASTLLSFGPSLVKRRAGETAWKGQVIISRALLNNVSERYREEIAAFQATSGLSEDELIASQMLYDTNNAFGCSSIIVPTDRSATSGPLLGRNFDYASLGLLHANDLVKVIRPQGKYAFASVSFPGCFGVISGINEHGLAIALHEVRQAADESAKFNSEGVPTLLALRQLLEECRNVDEAYKLLSELPRTTMFNLALCDPKGGAVFEVTTKQVIRRDSKGVNACTNHFRSNELCIDANCERYDTLMASEPGKYTVNKVFSKLDAVNQGENTFQSMVFEPQRLVLHVAIERRPSTKGELRRLDLEPLLHAK